MTRFIPHLVALTLAASVMPASADQKSDCMRGVRMIKSELKKKHPAPVLDQLRNALKNAETEVDEADWPEYLDAVNAARKALRK